MKKMTKAQREKHLSKPHRDVDLSGRVTVRDDSFRRNRVVPLTDDLRKTLQDSGAYVPLNMRYWPIQDKYGAQVQDKHAVDFVYKGKHLEHAVKRARRWMTSHPGNMNAPTHIKRFMAVLQKVDPSGFAELAAA